VSAGVGAPWERKGGAEETMNREGQPATSQPVERVRTVVAPSPRGPVNPCAPFILFEGAWRARR